MPAREGSDYYYAFATCEAALEVAAAGEGTGAPLALILQRESLDEPEPGHYLHVQEERIAEWPVAFRSRPRRAPRTIPASLAPDAPANRLEVLWGLATPKPNFRDD